MTSTSQLDTPSTTEPSRTTPTTTSTSHRPRKTPQGQLRHLKGTAHLGITIDGGRQPSAARTARSAAKIHTAPLAVIVEGWPRC